MDNKQRMLENARKNVEGEIDRIKNGVIVCTKTDSENNKIVVTKNISTDKEGNEVILYGYMLYYPYLDKPYCYIESPELFTDFDKRTSVEGNALPYSGPKSVLERNLTGRFTEYIRDGSFDMYNVYFKSKPTDQVRVTSSVHGFYHRTDPVQLAFIDFKSGDITVAAGAHKLDENIVSIDHANIGHDGKIDKDQMIEGLLDEMRAEGFFSEKYINLTEKEMMELAKETIENRLDLFGQIKEKGLINGSRGNIGNIGEHLQSMPIDDEGPKL